MKQLNEMTNEELIAEAKGLRSEISRLKRREFELVYKLNFQDVIATYIDSLSDEAKERVQELEPSVHLDVDGTIDKVLEKMRDFEIPDWSEVMQITIETKIKEDDELGIMLENLAVVLGDF